MSDNSNGVECIESDVPLPRLTSRGDLTCRCDHAIREELASAGIAVVEGSVLDNYASGFVTGKLGTCTFVRARDYWAVHEPVPLGVFNKIDHSGVITASCPRTLWGVIRNDGIVLEIRVDPTGAEEAEHASLSGFGNNRLLFVRNLAEAPNAQKFIDGGFGISTLEGLKLFANAMSQWELESCPPRRNSQESSGEPSAVVGCGGCGGGIGMY